MAIIGLQKPAVSPVFPCETAFFVEIPRRRPYLAIEEALGRPRAMDTAADLAKASMSENTRRAYGTALRGFECSGNPETDAGIAAYLGNLYEGEYAAAVAAMARLRYGR